MLQGGSVTQLLTGGKVKSLEGWTGDGYTASGLALTEGTGASHQIYTSLGARTTGEIIDTRCIVRKEQHAYGWFLWQVLDFGGHTGGVYFSTASTGAFGSDIGTVSRYFKQLDDSYFAIWLQYVIPADATYYLNFLGAEKNNDVTYTGNGLLGWRFRRADALLVTEPV